MKKMFAWMQSNGNMADENFERMQSNGYAGDAKILNGLGRKDERLVGGVMCQVFLEQILSVSDSVRIQCIILRSRKSFACSCVKMMNENNCVFFNLLQSNQVKRTPQEYINEFIIQKLNPLLVVDFRLISAFLYV